MPLTPPDRNSAGGEHTGTFLAVPVSAPPPSGRYLPGSVLSGKYRLDALLGEGGMGAVWRASNVLLDLPVAIKLIRADLDRGALRARLQLEARSAAKLGHPAIVRVYDVGESEFGDPFIVMELLQGETLAKILSYGRMSGARAVQLLLPIIDALGMAHARGIVHRDLKPDNLMIASEDQHVQPKILDFGIAKLTDPRDSDRKLTEVGTVVGSPDYMSPEQARGRDDVDASTDIWSICVVLYEAITGSAPFNAPNYNALLRAIVEDQPKSIVELAAGDQHLWNIVQRGLAKDRNQRFSTMSELGRALAAWLVGHGVQEDASGASIESKWLGGHGDSLASSVGSSATRAISAEHRPKLTQDSEPGATGVGRGVFSATIRPHASGRKRIVGVALAMCALLGLSAAGLARHSNALQAKATSLRASAVSVPAVLHPAPRVSPAEPAAPAQLAPAAEPRDAEVTESKPPPALAHSAAKSPTKRLATSAPRNESTAPKPTAAVPAASSVKAAPRALDLLAPY